MAPGEHKGLGHPLLLCAAHPEVQLKHLENSGSLWAEAGIKGPHKQKAFTTDLSALHGPTTKQFILKIPDEANLRVGGMPTAKSYKGFTGPGEETSLCTTSHETSRIHTRDHACQLLAVLLPVKHGFTVEWEKRELCPAFLPLIYL